MNTFNQHIFNGDTDHEPRELPLAKLRAGDYNVRAHPSPAAIEALADDIVLGQLINPVTVRRIGDHYEVIAGYMRWAAYKKLGRETIPVTIINVDDATARRLNLTENTHRTALTNYEAIKGTLNYIIFLLAQCPAWEDLTAKHTHEADPHMAATLWVLSRAAISHPDPDKTAATALGITPAALTNILNQVFGSIIEVNVRTYSDNHLRTLRLPKDLHDAFAKDQIGISNALDLSSITNAEHRAKLLKQLITEQLSNRQLKTAIAQLPTDQDPETPASSPTPSKSAHHKQLIEARRRANKKWRNREHLTDKQAERITKLFNKIAQAFDEAKPETSN